MAGIQGETLPPTPRDAQNLLEAASSGAAISVKVVANIAANLIAFLAVLAFINAALAWLGDMVDVEGLSFQVAGGRLAGLGLEEPPPPGSRPSTVTPVSPAPLLLHPAARGFPSWCGLGRLCGGGRAGGHEALFE